MQITITRTGGFSGLRRQWVVAVDDATAATVVHAMTSDASGVGAGHGAEGSPDRDRFSYVFAAGHHRITIAESHLDGPWRDMLDRAEPRPTA